MIKLKLVVNVYVTYNKFMLLLTNRFRIFTGVHRFPKGLRKKMPFVAPLRLWNSSGVYILEKISAMSFGGKNMKRPREKAEHVEEKGRKGNKNEKRGSKRVK